MRRPIFWIFFILCVGQLQAADDLRPLSKKLISGVKNKTKPTLAVLNFPYAKNKMSTGSHLVSERMVTYLVQGGATVVERRLLEKILEERKLWDTGVAHSDLAKTVGKLVGADAVVTGLLSDLSETQTEVFARIVKIDSGEIMSAAASFIDRIWRDPPRLPRAAQPRSAVPGAMPYLPTSLESPLDQNVSEPLTETSRKNRRSYYSVPIPVSLISNYPASRGGSSK
ncbi:MAG: hypothetical protein KCHDKBKB_01785 [Elusimicrobia bacterium]|nr:hypothetical protein [Elusimicrobiota bacterium]